MPGMDGSARGARTNTKERDSRIGRSSCVGVSQQRIGERQ